MHLDWPFAAVSKGQLDHQDPKVHQDNQDHPVHLDRLDPQDNPVHLDHQDPKDHQDNQVRFEDVKTGTSYFCQL